ncbi:hypothetical protein ACEYYH_10660 [Microbacterium trichothecenolyticum]|uniref:hypothetical protein n=1 Tax=Microbacterium trichothecenolyticum TaxID=69370 RepID=UPI0035BE16B6
MSEQQEVDVVEVATWPNGEVVDAASVEAFAEESRLVAAALFEDDQIRTPDWVITELALVSRHASRMVKVIMNAETLKRQAATKLARAKAQARLDHAKLPSTQQTAQIVLATVEEQDEYDVAVAAFEYARRIGNLLSDYTGRVQSIGKQVELTYSTTPGTKRGPF